MRSSFCAITYQYQQCTTCQKRPININIPIKEQKRPTSTRLNSWFNLSSYSSQCFTLLSNTLATH
jgi:hypothetical protein